MKTEISNKESAAKSQIPEINLALGLVMALWLFSMTPAWAQSYTIDWFTINGGSASTGGVYTLKGVIGQPATAQLSGGNYQVQGGFLAGIGLVQMPGAPRLSLALTNGNAVLSWPLPGTGFLLEQATTPATNQTQWTSVADSYQTNATSIFIMQPVQPGNRFFRLKKP